MCEFVKKYDCILGEEGYVQVFAAFQCRYKNIQIIEIIVRMFKVYND